MLRFHQKERQEVNFALRTDSEGLEEGFELGLLLGCKREKEHELMYDE